MADSNSACHSVLAPYSRFPSCLLSSTHVNVSLSPTHRPPAFTIVLINGLPSLVPPETLAFAHAPMFQQTTDVGSAVCHEFYSGTPAGHAFYLGMLAGVSYRYIFLFQLSLSSHPCVYSSPLSSFLHSLPPHSLTSTCARPSTFTFLIAPTRTPASQ